MGGRGGTKVESLSLHSHLACWTADVPRAQCPAHLSPPAAIQDEQLAYRLLYQPFPFPCRLHFLGFPAAEPVGMKMSG